MKALRLSAALLLSIATIFAAGCAKTPEPAPLEPSDSQPAPTEPEDESDSLPVNTITGATETEQRIMDFVSFVWDGYFMTDFRTDETIRGVRIGVDTYKDGELVGNDPDDCLEEKFGDEPAFGNIGGWFTGGTVFLKIATDSSSGGAEFKLPECEYSDYFDFSASLLSSTPIEPNKKIYVFGGVKSAPDDEDLGELSLSEIKEDFSNLESDQYYNLIWVEFYD